MSNPCYAWAATWDGYLRGRHSRVIFCQDGKYAGSRPSLSSLSPSYPSLHGGAEWKQLPNVTHITILSSSAVMLTSRGGLFIRVATGYNSDHYVHKAAPLAILSKCIFGISPFASFYFVPAESCQQCDPLCLDFLFRRDTLMRYLALRWDVISPETVSLFSKYIEQ